MSAINSPITGIFNATIFCSNINKIAVINALGRAEINIMLDNPFEVVKEIAQKLIEKGMEIKEIIEITGLTENEIKKLTKPQK